MDLSSHNKLEEISHIQILSKEKKFKDLFKYATKRDKFIMSIGFLCALIVGTLQPFIMYLAGVLFGSLKENSTKDDFYNSAVNFSISMVICGIIYFLFATVAVRCFIMIGSRQAFHFRRMYFSSILEREPQ